MVAVHESRRSGQGQVVDVTLYEPFLRIIELVVMRYDQTGKLKPRLGNQMEEDVPRNVYATADGGFITISCGSERIFENLLKAMGRLDLIGDPRFTGMSARVQNRDAIDDIVAAWMKGQRAEDALALLEKFDVVAGRVNDISDVLGDPHVAAREAIATLLDGTLGSVRMPAPVPRLSETPGRIRWSGGEMGAHNKDVFEGLLGMTSGRVETLKRQGII